MDKDNNKDKSNNNNYNKKNNNNENNIILSTKNLNKTFKIGTKTVEAVKDITVSFNFKHSNYFRN